MQVRRFFCPLALCPKRTFAERFGSSIPPFARRTTRLTDALRALTFTAGGQGSARLAQLLAMPLSPRTALRLLHAHPLPLLPMPHVVGLDDWAWKKGRSYGTICVDLEHHQPIDLLPDREPATIAAWLQEHPSIEIVARDRGGEFIDGVRQGAPQAIQVADRFHLLKNLGDALEYLFHQHTTLMKEVFEALAAQQVASTPNLQRIPSLDGASTSKRAKTSSQAWERRARERYQQIHDLQAQRIDVATIARHLRLSRPTVYRYLQMPAPPTRSPTHVRERHVIEPWKPYLVQRWNEGCRNALELWRELRDQHDYRHSPRTVARFLELLRRESGTYRSFRQVASQPIYAVDMERMRPLTALQTKRLWLSRPQERSAWLEAYRLALCTRDDTLAKAYTLTQDFVTMMRERRGDRLDQWLSESASSGITPLQTFATGLQRDYAAVKAGLTLNWSNGQTEAQVQRLKLLKRAMYGQADFELLRKRVLYREQPYRARSKAGHDAAAA